QNAPPSPPNYVRQGESACTAQIPYVAVPIDIYFVPVDSGSLNTVGTPYKYSIVTDLLGPPAPAMGMQAVGNGFLVVNWTANADTDTTGYDVFLDPIPGQEDASPPPASPPPADAAPLLVCSETWASSIQQDATASTSEAGCILQGSGASAGGSSAATSC